MMITFVRMVKGGWAIKVANEVHGELVLDLEETIDFVYHMLHPDAEAMRRRDDFMRGLDGMKLNYTNGEITLDAPDIDLPCEKNEGVIG